MHRTGVAYLRLHGGWAPPWLFNQMTRLGKAMARVMVDEYGTEVSRRDPVKYSFAFGGKDSVPFPVKRLEYDHATEVLENAVKQSKLHSHEKLNAIKRLKNYWSNASIES